MASVTCFEPLACSTVARAIARTIAVDFWELSRIFLRARSASFETSTPRETFWAPRSTAMMALRDSAWIVLMSSAISLVLPPARSARSLISSATTAKPLPCSPA